jgi:hypothetical protein
MAEYDKMADKNSSWQRSDKRKAYFEISDVNIE